MSDEFVCIVLSFCAQIIKERSWDDDVKKEVVSFAYRMIQESNRRYRTTGT